MIASTSSNIAGTENLSSNASPGRTLTKDSISIVTQRRGVYMLCHYPTISKFVLIINYDA